MKSTDVKQKKQKDDRIRNAGVKEKTRRNARKRTARIMGQQNEKLRITPRAFRSREKLLRDKTRVVCYRLRIGGLP